MSKPGKNQQWENFPAGAVERNPSAKAGDAGLTRANPRASGPMSPTTEPLRPDPRRHHERSRSASTESPRPPQGEKAHASSKDPAQPKTSKWIKRIKETSIEKSWQATWLQQTINHQILLFFMGRDTEKWFTSVFSWSPQGVKNFGGFFFSC